MATTFGNKVASLAFLALLGYGAYQVAPVQTAEFGNSAVELTTAVMNSIPGFDGASLPSPLELLPASPSAEGVEGDHSFLALNPDGSPTRWDPCTPIHFVVNPDNALPGAVEDTQEAFNQISATTGLTFIYDGLSTEIPQSDYTTKLTSDGGYPPVLVAWAPMGSSDVFQDSNDSGRATASTIDASNGQKKFVTGFALLNSDHNSIYEPGFGQGQTRGTLLLHELGHTIGLNHAEGAHEVMSTQISPVTPGSYTLGDTSGFKEIDASLGCLS